MDIVMPDSNIANAELPISIARQSPRPSTMTSADLRAKIRESSAHNRCDLTRLLADTGAFAAAVSGLARPFRDGGITVVAAVESMGLPLGGAVAAQLSAGLVMLRKPGKVAWPVRRADYRDYEGEAGFLEMADDAVSETDRVLIVDDWTETGGQLKAAVELIEAAGAHIAGIAVLNADRATRDSRFFQQYRLHAVFKYDE